MSISEMKRKAAMVRWSNPKARSHARRTMLSLWKDPSYVNRRHKSALKNWSENYDERVKSMRTRSSRRNRSKSALLRFSKPEEILKASERTTRAWESGAFKDITYDTKKKVRAGKRVWMNPKFRKKMAKAFANRKIRKKRFRYEGINGVILMRSSWEVKYANHLDFHKILWEYESWYFEIAENRIYTPDFYLPKMHTYVEIKGFFRDKDKEKIKLFNKNFPNKKLIVLGKEILSEMKVI